MSSYTDMFGKVREMPGAANPNQSALQQNLAAGPQVYEGFNENRPQNVNKSAKDSFLELAKRAPSAPIHDKGLLGGWFDQYIRTGMDERGHKTTCPAQGDKFSYGNHEGNFTVDFGRGAGAQGGALAWQAEGSDEATRQRYGGQPTNHTMPVPYAPTGISPSSTGNGGLLDAIMASLQAQQEPDSQAILQQAMR